MNTINVFYMFIRQTLAVFLGFVQHRIFCDVSLQFSQSGPSGVTMLLLDQLTFHNTSDKHICFPSSVAKS